MPTRERTRQRPSGANVALFALVALAALLGFVLLLSLLVGWPGGTGRSPFPVGERPRPGESAGLPTLGLGQKPAAAEKSRAVVGPPSSTPTPTLPERLALGQMLPRDIVALLMALRPELGAVPRVVCVPATIGDVPPSDGGSTDCGAPLGASEVFWVSDVDPTRYEPITATLRLCTEHAEMWVEDGAVLEAEALERAAHAFEQHIYPTNHRYFGQEWIPGIDGNPRLLILNAYFSGAAGYFSSANETSRLANPYSNEHEMFALNLGALDPGSSSYESVLAHEFQHMIHWAQDSNEDAWVSEGCSELAEDLNGYQTSQASVRALENRPSTQLNTWSDDAATVGAHYGASYLLLRYFADRFGADLVRELVQEPANGIAGFEALFTRRGITTTFDAFFADWLVANSIDDPRLADGRYGYQQTDVSLRFQKQVALFPSSDTGEVPQYSADYIELVPSRAGALHVVFTGTSVVKLVPNDPPSGRWQWWSNRGDASQSYLERSFDLRNVATATLGCSLWYDIEGGWDYAYVRASTDGGITWRLLRGTRMTDYDPNGNALGPGYSGRSGDAVEPDDGADVRPDTGQSAPQWVRETIDLAEYCGQVVLLRFDYVTDDAINANGLCLDDFELATIGYRDDAEDASSEDPARGGWHAVGFVRHDNRLAQRYIVQLVSFGPGVEIRRLPVPAPADQEGDLVRAEWLLDGFGGAVQRALLIIAPTAPTTTERATYQLRLEQLSEP